MRVTQQDIRLSYQTLRLHHQLIEHWHQQFPFLLEQGAYTRYQSSAQQQWKAVNDFVAEQSLSFLNSEAKEISSESSPLSSLQIIGCHRYFNELSCSLKTYWDAQLTMLGHWLEDQQPLIEKRFIRICKALWKSLLLDPQELDHIRAAPELPHLNRLTAVLNDWLTQLATRIQLEEQAVENVIETLSGTHVRSFSKTRRAYRHRLEKLHDVKSCEPAPQHVGKQEGTGRLQANQWMLLYAILLSSKDDAGETLIRVVTQRWLQAGSCFVERTKQYTILKDRFGFYLDDALRCYRNVKIHQQWQRYAIDHSPNDVQGMVQWLQTHQWLFQHMLVRQSAYQLIMDLANWTRQPGRRRFLSKDLYQALKEECMQLRQATQTMEQRLFTRVGRWNYYQAKVMFAAASTGIYSQGRAYTNFVLRQLENDDPMPARMQEFFVTLGGGACLSFYLWSSFSVGYHIPLMLLLSQLLLSEQSWVSSQLMDLLSQVSHGVLSSRCVSPAFQQSWLAILERLRDEVGFVTHREIFQGLLQCLLHVGLSYWFYQSPWFASGAAFAGAYASALLATHALFDEDQQDVVSYKRSLAKTLVHGVTYHQVYRHCFFSLLPDTKVASLSTPEALSLLELDEIEKEALTPSLIKQAYRKQAMKWHPDKCAAPAAEECAERFYQAGVAKEILLKL